MPDILMNDTLTIHDGELSIKVIHFGGHTQSDVVMYVPSEGFVATGDLVADFEPFYFGEADANRWIRSIDQLETMSFRYLAGARGKVQVGKSTMINFREYLQEMSDLACKAADKGTSKEEFLKTILVDSMKSLSHNGYKARIESRRAEMQDAIWNSSLQERITVHAGFFLEYFKKKK